MSLSNQLREAAIDRARESGNIIDSCVLGPDGVIDLTVLNDAGDDTAGTGPLSALSQTLGGFRDELEIDDLYNDEEIARFGWQRRR